MKRGAAWRRRSWLALLLPAVAASAAGEPAAAGPARATDDDLRLSHGNQGDETGAGARRRVNFDFKRLPGRKKAPAFKG